MKSFFVFVSSLFFISLLALLAWGVFYSSNPNEIPSALIGTKAADFKARSFDNQEIKISNFTGKLVVLNFWASWCVECKREASILEKANQSFPAQKLQVLGVAINDSYPAAKKFAAQYGKTYPLVLDDSKGSIALDYGVTAVPESFLINEEGIIEKKIIGQIQFQDIEDFFRKHENQ